MLGMFVWRISKFVCKLIGHSAVIMVEICHQMGASLWPETSLLALAVSCFLPRVGIIS